MVIVSPVRFTYDIYICVQSQFFDSFNYWKFVLM